MLRATCILLYLLMKKLTKFNEGKKFIIQFQNHFILSFLFNFKTSAGVILCVCTQRCAWEPGTPTYNQS